jgi:hypothetical protein
MVFLNKNKKNNQGACPAKLVTRETSVKWVKRSGGFFTLTMVLLVCGAVLIISTGIFLRSISQLREGGDSENALKAWSTVNACSEYALGKLAPNWSYAGAESLTIGGQTCYIYAVVASGTSKLIKASSTVSGFTKKVLIEVATNTPSVAINSWSMVADF